MAQSSCNCRAARPRRPAALTLIASGLITLAAATSAQGISPGELPQDGARLPGGTQPLLHLRSYYFDQDSLTGQRSTAWALGGWAGLRTPWWGDVVQLGAVGYTSQRLYGPDDKGGTLLLQADQDAINVIGLAWAAVRFAGQTFTAYRQLIDRPFINPQDSRMVPNTFEAYTLGGRVAELAYTGGYIAKIKTRGADRFVPMSRAAGGSGSNEGVYFAGVDWGFTKDGRVRADLQHGVDTFNTFYLDAKLPIAVDERTRLTLGAQYFPQRAVGDHQIGDFSTWGAGLQASLARGPFEAKLSLTRTGSEFATQSPYGDHASYLNQQQVAFNSAGERAWGVGGSIDFAGFGAPGLSAAAAYASGSHRQANLTGARLSDRYETDLRADYRFGKGHLLAGLVVTLRYAWLREGDASQPQGRVIVNYPFSF